MKQGEGEIWTGILEGSVEIPEVEYRILVAQVSPLCRLYNVHGLMEEQNAIWDAIHLISACGIYPRMSKTRRKVSK